MAENADDNRSRLAPDPEEFAVLVAAAYEKLPASFRALCGDVVIHTADFADRDALDDLGIDDPMELSGLYEGIALTKKSVTDPPAIPARVHLYRKPIIAEAVERGDRSLKALVTHVLVHEIGHHFGLSDEDMHRIEEACDA
ncbi:MAG: metallopeptidase family protein [Pseudomonadota bacterium]